MYTVYSRPGSGGFVVEAALALAGQPYTLTNVAKGAPPPGFETISPLGQIPVLTLPDGAHMTESAAICLLLAERYPEAGLGPTPGDPARAQFLRWLMVLSSGLYPVLLEFYYPHRHTTDPVGIEQVKEAATAACDRIFAAIEQRLAGREWLAGDAMTIADVYLLMLAYWHPVAEKPRAEWVNIVNLCARVAQHPVIAELNLTHRFW